MLENCISQCREVTGRNMGPMHVLVIVFITILVGGFYLFWFKLAPWV